MKISRFASLPLAIAALVAAPFTLAAPPPFSPSTGTTQSPLVQPMHLTGIPAVQLSYRGRRLATIIRRNGKAVLTIENVNGSNPQPVVIPDGCSPTAIRWAPRWDDLAVLTQCTVDSAHPQPTGAVWVMDVNSGKPLRKLANFDGTASELQWRSDGKMIAFLYTAAPPIGSKAKYASVIMAGMIDGGKLGSQSPANLDIHEFNLSRGGNVLAYTATPLTSPSAPPALYEVVSGKTKLVFDPATATGALHGLRVSLPRWSIDAGGPGSLFFLGKAASAAIDSGADLYMKLPNEASPVTNLTAEEQAKPQWFIARASTALTTRIVDGATQFAVYQAFTTGAGLSRSTDLCTIAGAITDGHGPGSIATGGRRYAYFEYPKSGGPMVLKVGRWHRGMACTSRWTIQVASLTSNGGSPH